MRKLPLLFIFLFQLSFGQQSKIDSLRLKLSEAKNDEQKLQIHEQICNAAYINSPKTGLESAKKILNINTQKKTIHNFANRYIGIYYMNRAQFDSAIYYFNKNLKQYDFSKDYKQAYTDLTNKGNVYRYQKKQDSALFYLSSAKNLAEKHNLKEKYTNIYNGLAGFYHYDNQPQLAIKYYLKAIDSSVYLKSKARLISVYNNIGNVFKDIDNYEKGIEYLNKGYELAKKMNHKQGIADASLNLANCYSYSKINIDSIPIFYERSIDIYKKINDNIFLLEAYENYGNFLSENNKVKEALEIKNKALDLATVAGMEDKIFGINVSLAKSYLRIKSYAEALKHTDIALKDTINKKISSFENKLDLFKTKAAIDKKLNNFKSSLKFQEKYANTLSEYNATINKKSINELETKYQTEKKEKENLQLKAKNTEQALLTQKANTRNWLLLFGLLAVGISAFFIFRRYKSEAKARKIISQQKDEIEQQKNLVETLQKELHHRMKNNLSFIDLFISLAKGKFQDPAYQTKLNELQNRMHSMFEVHKQLFKKDDVTTVKAKNYIDTLVENVQKSYAKENITFSNTTHINETILADTSFPVGLIVNEFVTNSYKYAFDDATQGSIDINLASNPKEYILKLKDNGKGLPKDFNINNLDSFGLETIQLLTQEYGGTFTLNGTNGVTMNITLPKTAA